MLNNLIDVKVDAKQTLDTLNDKSAIEQFMNMIFIPDENIVQQLLDGTRYFLTGTKGTGKTAFLIYTALKAEEVYQAERNFIIFKEFSQEEREDYKRLAHITTYDQSGILPYFDYLTVWNWMFHVSIFDTVMNSDKVIFERNETLELYLAAIKAIKSNMRGPNRRLPIITENGFVEADLEVPIKDATVKLTGKINFEFDQTDRTKVRFSTHVENLNQLYAELEAGESQLYIVVDELNLSTKNNHEFERDICMIRDMIIAIERFNTLTNHYHQNVRLIGAVRTEVINSVKIHGQEVNKSIESFGIPVDWTKYTMDGIKHPLIRLMINYFSLSERGQQVAGDSDQDIYDRWVDPYINSTNSDQYIRNYTLYRPRDIVRMLNLFKLNCGAYSKISTQTFNEIKRQYSNDCWNEIIEELVVTYTPQEIEYIQGWLTGSPRLTTFDDLKKRASAYWGGRTQCESLLRNFDELLQQLYKAGVLGNYIKYPNGAVHHRWYFRGEDMLIPEQPIQIHKIFSVKLSTF